MTPQEHYAEAERLLEAARDSMVMVRDSLVQGQTVAVVDTAQATVALTVATAQVHATLAVGLTVEQHVHQNIYRSDSDGAV